MSKQDPNGFHAFSPQPSDPEAGFAALLRLCDIIPVECGGQDASCVYRVKGQLRREWNTPELEVLAIDTTVIISKRGGGTGHGIWMSLDSTARLILGEESIRIQYAKYGSFTQTDGSVTPEPRRIAFAKAEVTAREFTAAARIADDYPLTFQPCSDGEKGAWGMGIDNIDDLITWFGRNRLNRS